MASNIKLISDALVEFLNGHPYTIDFVALRRNRMFLQQEEPNRVIVVVSPAGVITGVPGQDTRGSWGEQIDLAVSLAHPLGGTLAEEDDLVELIGEQIPHSILGRPMGIGKHTTLDDGGSRVMFHEGAMDEAFLYLATLSVSYRIQVKES